MTSQALKNARFEAEWISENDGYAAILQPVGFDEGDEGFVVEADEDNANNAERCTDYRIIEEYVDGHCVHVAKK